MTETPATHYPDGYVASLEERLAALELALEDVGWQQLSFQTEQEFSRAGLRTIAELSRIFYLKNPIVQRGVDIKRLYVWGQGWTVKAGEPEIQAVLDTFLYDLNDDIIGSHEARMQLEIELATDGNLFFVFFPSAATGRIKVRTIPFAEIEEVICNPDDAKEPWYYRRQWTQMEFSPESGVSVGVPKTAYYPDWRYQPTAKPQTIAGFPVHWESAVYHVKVGGFSNWRFGVPEVYDQIDWAKAYKEFLEDWASIVRAYRRFAFQLTTPGGSRGVAAAKTRLGTTLGTGGIGMETNPAPIAGSTFIAGDGYKLDAVRTSGATVGAEDGRRLLLMVAAGAGIPEVFYGDANVGNHATAKTLDRPTELLMEDRQQLWRDVYLSIFDYVLRWAVKAGMLRSVGSVAAQVEDGRIVEKLTWNNGVDGTVTVEFPPLLQHDIPQMIGATIDAATLRGAPLAGTMDLPTLARLLLVTLGVSDADEIVERLFPGGEVPEEEEPPEGAPERPQAEAMMIAAVQELRTALVKLQEGATHG